ncbi:MAG: TrmJ/YjtD family RNA methyltransferase [Deltaproteobacteria bacterium]|nr:TrmJ/YjtD family RNA methyltransferase [Deltaproteobacteria bacterium]
MRPRNPENLGAVARVMRNFGLATWTLVDPRTLDFAAARRVAVHSEEILDKPQLVPSLDEAVSRAAWVVGTSSRKVPGVPVFTPREFAAAAAERAQAGQEIALVFGDERAGLSNEEVARCHALSRVPVDEAQPSINLAQSVGIYAYELRQALLAPREATPRPAATDAELQQLEAKLVDALAAVHFVDPENPRHAVRDLARAFQRAQLSPRELRLWIAALSKIAKSVPGS